MKNLAIFALTFALTAVFTSAHADKTVRIGYANWADNLTTTHIVKTVIEEHLDKDVELVKGDAGAIFQGLASGDLDIFTGTALPETHRDYYDEVASDVMVVGPIYYRLRQGWVVPDYVPLDKVSSIDDLKSEEIRNKFNGKIIGIDPGSGLMRISKKAMNERGLKEFGYELQSSSGPGMTSALKRAIDREEWVIVTGWQPHWMWARWDLRFISPEPGPDALYSSYDNVVITVHEEFPKDHQKVLEILDRMTVPLDKLQALIFEAEQNDGNYAEVARSYVEDNPKLVNYWVTGEFPD